MRLLRSLLLVKAGFLLGLAAGGLVVKRALPPRGDEESDEVSRTAVFGGVELESRASSFRGGSLLAWWGGIAVDLRQATIAPEAHLDVACLWGGVALRLPPGVRVKSNVTGLMGGVAIEAPEPDDPAAPTLVIDGFTLFGGVAVKSSATDDEQT